MSEAVLYVIDNVILRDTLKATEIVEEYAEREDAPSTRLSLFAAELLTLWPEDGSAGMFWHENSLGCRPNSQVLKLELEAAAVDADRLAQLRRLAKDYGLHLFDPEGEVVYLSNGREAGPEGPIIPATAPVSPRAADGSLRMDGVYEGNVEGEWPTAWSYLWFTPDVVNWLDTRGPLAPTALLSLGPYHRASLIEGSWQAHGEGFRARLPAGYATFRLEGQLTTDGLQVHSELEDGTRPFDLLYRFKPFAS